MAVVAAIPPVRRDEELFRKRGHSTFEALTDPRELPLEHGLARLGSRHLGVYGLEHSGVVSRAIRPPKTYSLPTFEDTLGTRRVNFVENLTDASVVKTSVGINLLLFLPIVGWIAYVIVLIAQEALGYNKLNDEEQALYEKLVEQDTGLSLSRIRLLSKFIINQAQKPHDKPTVYESNSFFFVDGSIPRKVTVFPDGRILVNVFNKVVEDDEMRISRALLIRLDKEFIQVHVRKQENTLEVKDIYSPMQVSGTEGPKPVRCYIIRHNSDLSQLYPLGLDEEGSSLDQYVDVAFHAYHTDKDPVTYVVNFGQNLGSKGNVNRSVAHVDMVRGRVGKGDDQRLIIESATGVVGTMLEYSLNPREKLRPGKELHVFRFKREDIDGLNPKELTHFMLQFAQRQTNRKPKEIFLTHGAEEAIRDIQTRSYIPGLYMYTDGMKSVLLNEDWCEAAADRLSLAIANELAQHRFSTIEGELIGGICSSFTSLSYQVGATLATIGKEELGNIISNAKRTAHVVTKEELAAVISKVKQHLEKLKKNERGLFAKRAYTDLILALENMKTAENADAYSKSVEKVVEIIEAIIRYYEDEGSTHHIPLSEARKQLTKVQVQANKELKSIIYRYFFRMLKDAPSNPLNPLHRLMNDPMYKLNSRWIMPSSLHGIVTRKADSIQVVPPAPLRV